MAGKSEWGMAGKSEWGMAGGGLVSGRSVFWESFLRQLEMQKSVVHILLSGVIAPSPLSSSRMLGGKLRQMALSATKLAPV